MMPDFTKPLELHGLFRYSPWGSIYIGPMMDFCDDNKLWQYINIQLVVDLATGLMGAFIPIAPRAKPAIGWF